MAKQYVKKLIIPQTGLAQNTHLLVTHKIFTRYETNIIILLQLL